MHWGISRLQKLFWGWIIVGCGQKREGYAGSLSAYLRGVSF